MGLGLVLARNRRSPKRPSEPRLSGVRPEEGEVGQIAELPTNESGRVSPRAFDRCIGGTRCRITSTQFARNGI